MRIVFNHIEDLKYVFSETYEDVFAQINVQCMIADILYSDANNSDKEYIKSLSQVGVVNVISFDSDAMTDIVDLHGIYGNSVSINDLFSIYIADVFEAKLLTNEALCVDKCKMIGVDTTSKIDLINYLKLNKTA